MRLLQLTISVLILAVLVSLNRIYAAEDALVFGGLSWVGWLSLVLVIVGFGLIVLLRDSARAAAFFRRRNLATNETSEIRVLSDAELAELEIRKYKGPEYPHPVVFTDRCIGCQACVDACPHDVLAIVDGAAAVIAADQCMEDTACEAECPVNPKACIVINTAKEVRSRPAPTRDGSTYQTNVPGCYIIGDVSGVPLIKNAAKEGAEVIEKICEELKTAEEEPKAEYDVVIVGIGPGGASAAITAQEKGIRYVGLEQEKILSTIAAYPKGKYIFFKPDTNDWNGGLPALGLGLSKSKYDTGTEPEADDDFSAELGNELDTLAKVNASIIQMELLNRIPSQIRDELSEPLFAKSETEFKTGLRKFLASKGNGGWKKLFDEQFVPKNEVHASMIRDEISNRLAKKIPGDQRERILELWMSELAEKSANINEEESCVKVEKADDGDYFNVETLRGTAQEQRIYKTRRVVLAIGLRGAPNKLRLPNEDLKIEIDGRPENKVLYSLANPAEYKGRNIIVVGGGNSAVEAAVDLVTYREGADIKPRSAAERNNVTLLVRSYFAPTVKFGNKAQLYKCFDGGFLDVKFEVAITELREREAVVSDVASGEVIASIPNDFVFALIGGERPDRFLQSIGIEVE